MSRPYPLAILASAALLGAGCASTSEPRSARAAPSHEAPQGSEVGYMQRVEQVARRRGIGVIWVNPPPRPRTVATGDGG